MQMTATSALTPTRETPILKRIHAKRLREVYRSAGWPSLDVVEIELLAAGLLERQSRGGFDTVQVTDAGIAYLAQAAQRNRHALSAHETLVEQVVRGQLQNGRLVWKNLMLRAWVAPQANIPGRWRISIPDVFSIRNSTVSAYLEPSVYEIKVSRADLLGDLKNPEKRAAYLDLGGQCWYVLGCDAKGRPIGAQDEIPRECGIMQWVNNKFDVLRQAPRRPVHNLPFALWMALAKATPAKDPVMLGMEMPTQAGLADEPRRTQCHDTTFV